MAKKTAKSAASAKRPTAKMSQEACELTTDSQKRQAANKQAASVKDALPPGLSQPALRALARAGYNSLSQLAKVDDAELLKLHGFGPKGIATIRAALKRKS
jgi:DNA-directed RNA polymerase alpha subunit